MKHPSYRQLLRHLRARHRDSRSRDPLALVLVDAADRRDPTIRHCLDAGFGQVVALGDPDPVLPANWSDSVHTAPFDVHKPGAYRVALNALSDALPGHWLHACFSGEYVFWPFGDHRDARDLTAFAQEERRSVVSGVIVDIYGETVRTPPETGPGVRCWFDRDGYTSEPVSDGMANEEPREFAIRGGLRLRLAHILKARERIDRVLLFRARRGLEVMPDLRFNIAEYNTRHCPWHRSVTAVLCSDRAARRLAQSRDRGQAPDTLLWNGATPFDWTARQLTKAGLMEPGQWV